MRRHHSGLYVPDSPRVATPEEVEHYGWDPERLRGHGLRPPIAGAAITEVSGFPLSSASLTVSPWQVSITTVTVGDLVICTGRHIWTSGGTMSVASVSGGGATGWQSVIEVPDSTNLRFLWIWMGTVSSATTANLVMTFSGTATISSVRVAADSFTAPGAIWTPDVSGSSGVGSSGTALSWPSLTPDQANALWWGYGAVNGTFSGGTPASFTFSSATANETCWNATPTQGTAYQPSGTNSSSGALDAVGAVFNSQPVGAFRPPRAMPTGV